MMSRTYSTNSEGTVKADRVELLALRAAIIAQIDADMARIDRMISALDLMDGDPDLEADYAFVIEDETGNLAWNCTSTDQEIDAGEEPEIENEHYDWEGEAV